MKIPLKEPANFLRYCQQNGVTKVLPQANAILRTVFYETVFP
jgi:hypothetical protein